MAKKSNLDKYLESGLLKTGDSPDFLYGRVPFGIPPLDDLTGGGIPQKRFTWITGQPSGGKSYLALQACKDVIESDQTPLWVDAELSWDAGWVEKCGVDPSKIMVTQPYNGEEAFDIVRDGMRDGIPLIVLDSLASLIPSSFHEEDFDHNPMAWQARLINTSLPRLMPELSKGSAVVFINQLRSAMSPTALPNMPGGQGQDFAAHMFLEVTRKGWIDEKETHVGFLMRVRTRKMKVSGKVFSECEIPFRVDGGIDLNEVGYPGCD